MGRRHSCGPATCSTALYATKAAFRTVVVRVDHRGVEHPINVAHACIKRSHMNCMRFARKHLEVAVPIHRDVMMRRGATEQLHNAIVVRLDTEVCVAPYSDGHILPHVPNRHGEQILSFGTATWEFSAQSVKIFDVVSSSDRIFNICISFAVTP